MIENLEKNIFTIEN